MARLTQAGVELKCRRCKRMVVVPLGGMTRDWIEVSMR
jgi:ribosomal protein S27E